jgi:DNA-binding CsgD family transcriptional regulator
VSGATTGLPLSPRGAQLLKRIADGMTNEDIAADLKVSVDTVKTTVLRLRTKLAASNRAHAVAVGFRRGLLR